MPTTSISTADAKEQFSELINRVSHNKDVVILTRRGKEIAAMVPIEDLQLIEQEKNNHDLQEAVDALTEARNIGTVALDDIKKRDDHS